MTRTCAPRQRNSGRCSVRDDIPSISSFVHSGDPADRTMALEKLCDLGEAARPTLLELMKAADADLCQDILKAMREKHIALPSKQSMVAARVSVLADKDRRVRLAAVVILGQIGADSPAAVTALVGELQYADLGVRVVAIEALGRIGPMLRGDHRSHRAIARQLPAGPLGHSPCAGADWSRCEGGNTRAGRLAARFAGLCPAGGRGGSDADSARRQGPDPEG